MLTFSKLIDIDECTENQHDCDKNAICTNAEGSFSCDCIGGYTGNGTSCQGKCVSCRLCCASLAEIFWEKNTALKRISGRKKIFMHMFFPDRYGITSSFYVNRYKRMFTKPERLS